MLELFITDVQMEFKEIKQLEMRQGDIAFGTGRWGFTYKFAGMAHTERHHLR